MKDFLDKFQTVLGAFMKLMYKVFGIFGVTDEDDDTGIKLSDALKDFTDEISNA